jgi:hypothetical protein
MPSLEEADELGLLERGLTMPSMATHTHTHTHTQYEVTINKARKKARRREKGACSMQLARFR